MFYFDLLQNKKYSLKFENYQSKMKLKYKVKISKNLLPWQGKKIVYIIYEKCF